MGFTGHWAGLPVVTACSRGRERRYCCDPQAWENIDADFGQRAFCQGGFIDYFGEPVDPLLCALAVSRGLDPHVVMDCAQLHYKPHKTWWGDHVRSVVEALAAPPAAAGGHVAGF